VLIRIALRKNVRGGIENYAFYPSAREKSSSESTVRLQMYKAERIGTICDRKARNGKADR
jgi:hypothetical protein